MNKVGIYFAYWTREWEADYSYYIDKAAKLGFDILEICTACLVDMPASQLRQISQRAQDKGISLTYCVGFPADKDMSSPDSAIRSDGIAYAKKTLKAIHTMGGKVFGGINYASWPSGLSEGITDKRPYLDRSINSMKEVIRTAEDYGIDYCFEVVNRFEQYLMNTAREAMDYVKEIGSPNAKILLDTFHMNIEEDSFQDAIITAGKRLGHFHIGETNRKPPGMGRMPWDEIASALRQIDYQGCVVMEPFLKMGGSVGRDIKIWRDLSDDGDEAMLDDAAMLALTFIREKLTNNRLEQEG
jgi:D-psicose/D-tagatose/L-ribulose 3-epimerase